MFVELQSVLGHDSPERQPSGWMHSQYFLEHYLWIRHFLRLLECDPLIFYALIFELLS